MKAALLTALQGASGLATLQAAGAITWAHPGDKQRRESVWLGDARMEPEESRIGNRVHYETYTIPVVGFVVKEGDDAQDTEERWWEFIAAVETALRADASLGAVSGLLWATVTGKEPHGFMPSQGRGYEGAVLVGCKARI